MFLGHWHERAFDIYILVVAPSFFHLTFSILVSLKYQSSVFHMGRR